MDWGRIEMIEKLREMVNTKEESNLLLARQLCGGIGYNFDRLLEEEFDVNFWREYINNYRRGSNDKIEVLLWILSLENIDMNPKLSNRYSLLGGDDRITYIPASIGKFSNLKHLNLAHNRLTSLPEELGDLQNLEGLSLAYNSFFVVPECIGRLHNLKSLALVDNPIEEDLSWLREMPNLKQIFFPKSKNNTFL